MVTADIRPCPLYILVKVQTEIFLTIIFVHLIDQSLQSVVFQ